MKKEKEGRIICVRNGITYRMAPFDGQQAVDQRLKNIVKLAIQVGRKQGLIGNHNGNGIQESEGEEDVADKRNIRNYKATPLGEDKAGDQGGR